MVVQVNLGKVSVFCRVSVACASKSSVAFFWRVSVACANKVSVACSCK